MSEDDIERVLRAAGARERVPREVEDAVRENLRDEWRRIVAERRGTRRRGRVLALAASVLVAALGLWIVASLSGTGGMPVGTVAAAVSEVRVRGGWLEGWEPASPGRALAAGDALETGAEGHAGLALPGIASARLDGGTRVRLASADRLVIERGAIYVDAGLEAQDSGRLLVETPAGVVRHVGTQYEVRVDGADVRVRVREGRVEWRSNSGAVQSGGAGEQLTIAANGRVERRIVPRYGASWDWIASTTPPIAIEGRPLSEFLAWAGRELGREVAFASPGLRREAEEIVVHGSIAGLTPQQALDAVLATTSVRSTLEDGHIRVTSGTAP